MLRPYTFYAGSFCRHIDVFFKQITACLPKSQAIKDAETTKKKAEAVFFSGYVMGSMWSMCKE